MRDLFERSRLAAALASSVPRRGTHPTARPAAVLVPVVDDGEHGAKILFIRRSDSTKTHQGQISFPGGGAEPEDRDRVDTALRETEEEVGIPRRDVRVLGELDEVLTVSDYLVRPVVGHLSSLPELVLDPAEVAEVLLVPVNALTAPNALVWQDVDATQRGWPRVILAYQCGDHCIWGATAMILRNLIAVASAGQIGGDYPAPPAHLVKEST